MTSEEKQKYRDFCAKVNANMKLFGIIPSAEATPEPPAPQGSLRCDGVVGLPDISELPLTVRQQLGRMTASQWTEDDWEDVLRLQRIVSHNRAVRHGLLKQPNVRSQL